MGKLSKCAWKVIRTYFEHAVPYSGILPGASIVVQSHGDFLNFENLLSWRHTGFHVYLGPRIWPDDHDALERLARYIIRACFSSDRVVYIHAEKTPDGIANGL